jgi:hypothetical protein
MWLQLANIEGGKLTEGEKKNQKKSLLNLS